MDNQHSETVTNVTTTEDRIDNINSINVPAFWVQKPQLWFTALEAQLLTKKITSDPSKYYIVISKLDQEALTVIEHIVADPPPLGKYEKIKETLIKHYSVSNENKIRTLISGLELGNRRPSELLAEIYRLGGPHLDSTIAKTLWLDRLPQYAQVALTAASDLDNEAMAQLADKILEIPRQPPGSYVMPVEDMQQNTTIATLTKQIDALTLKIDQISKKNHYTPRRRFNRRRRSNSRHQSSE